MPRELISREVEFDADPEYHGPDPVAAGAWLEKREYDLHVAWGRGSVDEPRAESVQVSVRKMVLGPPDGGLGDPVHGMDRYSTSLSRKEVNRLIKTLRKARDQVFGVDE